MPSARVLIAVLMISCVLFGSAAMTPSPAETACVPDVRITSRVTEKFRGNAVTTEITLTAGATVPGGDRLTSVRFLTATNAIVEVNGAPISVPSTIALSPSVVSLSFILKRTAAEAPYLVTFTATDLCGEISKFFGNGPAPLSTPVATSTATIGTISTATPRPTFSATTVPTSTAAATATSTPVPTGTPTTPPSGSAESPVKISMFYHPPTDGTTLSTVVKTLGAGVYTRGDEAARQQLWANGFSGPVTQYLLAHETSGPSGLVNSSTPCGSYLYYQNNPSGIVGDFCSALHGDEANFLHNGRGERLYGTQSWQEGGVTKRVYLYLMNPASPAWRAYAARVAREQVQSLGYTGVFLDNIDLSLYRGQRQQTNSDGIVAEYGSNAAYQQATAGFLQAVKRELGTAKLWANMANGTDTPTDWDVYTPHLDGFMNEYFAARWNGTYASTSVWETQLRQVEDAVRSGKTFLAVGQGSRTDSARMRFALASYLLVADHGVTFRYGDASGGEATSPGYYQLWQYPEYDAKLGAPTSDRYQSGGLWRRDFQCGAVTVNVSTNTGTISTDTSRPGCS